MSRSNPQAERNPHPAQRWFEWNGGSDGGFPRYYHKDKKEIISLEITEARPFTFLVLDETATVKGYNEAAESGIRSNEIKDISKEPFIVRTFAGKNPLANGLWTNIRDKVAAAGGRFTTNIYIAFRDQGELRIGCLQLSGAAFSAWLEFKKANRTLLMEKAITIGGYTEGKKGKVVFRVPVFGMKDVSPETNQTAFALDAELQKHFAAYFSKNQTERTLPEDDGNNYADQNAPKSDADLDVAPDDIPF